MNIELVTIGTELLLGFTVDTNGAEIARSLADNGVQVVRRVSVADDPGAIRAAVAEALQRTGTVLTTGGLGPTRDDMSKKVVAELYQAPTRVRRNGLGQFAGAICPAAAPAGAEQPEPG